MNPRLALPVASLALAAALLPLPAGAQPAAPLQMMSAPVARATPQESAGLVARLSALDARAGASADHSFRLASQHPGVVGQKITRAQHTYKNLRVFGSDAVLVTNDRGDIISVHSTDRRPGATPQAGNPGATPPAVPVPAPAPTAAAPASVTAPPAPANLTPALTGDDAIRAAAQHLAPAAVHRWPAHAELLIYPLMHTVRNATAVDKTDAQLNALDVEDVVARYALAYLVQLRMAQDGRLLYYDVLVDAGDGAILAAWPALQTVIGSGHSQYNGVVPISTTATATGFQMRDPARGSGGRFGAMAVTNANHSSPNRPDPGPVYSHSSNQWGDGQQYNGGSTTSANGRPPPSTPCGA